MSVSPQPFDLATTPLIPGVTLLEASAGTGKTYALAGIYLRLILETDLGVDRILVVTFTEAATAELRGRIRGRLAEARQVLRAGTSPDPTLEAALLSGTASDRARRLQRLELALEGFDAAAVFTIHGFCQRVLREQPFRTRARLDAVLEPDMDALVQEAADNFWRRQFYEQPTTRLLMARHAGLTPESLAALLRRHLGQAEPRVLPVADGPLPNALLSAADDALSRALDLWRTDRDAITAHFGNEGGSWGNAPYNNSTRMEPHWAALDALSEDLGTPAGLDAIGMLSVESLEGKRYKRSKQPVPSHPFFEACTQAMAAVGNAGAAWRCELLATAPRELSRLKERAGLMGFDDLLHQVAAALRGPDGTALAHALRRRYGAALIDEFQDTDPLQWDIFERAFATPDTHVYLVGDPKQAIYSFRGADVFAYLRARDHADRCFTLGMNWRSSSGLVSAINQLFGRHECPFVLPEIRFHPVTAAGRADGEPLTIGGQAEAALELWWWDDREQGITRREDRERHLAAATAAAIARMLSADTRIGSRRLVPGDIAVLVDRHAEARAIAAALALRRIPSVRQTQESVFATREAADLQALLEGLVDGASDAQRRAALMTQLAGVAARELANAREEGTAWEVWRERLAAWSDTWRRQGVLPLVETVMRDRDTRRRLLAGPDGERRLTNYLHLGERLQEAASSGFEAPRSLATWLSRHRAQAAEQRNSPEENLLRLERDADAVQLVTIHRSKGLEYPVVFCPFPGRSVSDRGATALFHDPANDHQLHHDVGTPDLEAHLGSAAGEQFAENVRLLYVALTRARHRCVVVWSLGKDVEKRALSWILHPPAGADRLDATGALEALSASLKDLPAETLRSALEQVQSPQICVRPLPEPDDRPWTPSDAGPTGPSARTFRGMVRRDWGSASFSALVHGVAVDRADADEASPGDPAEPEAPDPSLLPEFRGIAAGICLHEILEDPDSTSPNPATRWCLVEERLKANGFDPAAIGPRLEARVNLLTNAPLFDDIALVGVPAADCLREMEFTLPLKHASPRAIAAALAGGPHGVLGPRLAASMERLTFPDIRGILGGFVDLIVRAAGRWWLVDWKSNWLGATPESYRPERLEQAMLSEHYALQYHLYLLALHRLLRNRIPGYDYDRDFGGVRYVFFRGVAPASPGSGVFADRPAGELLRRLEATLLEALP